MFGVRRYVPTNLYPSIPELSTFNPGDFPRFIQLNIFKIARQVPVKSAMQLFDEVHGNNFFQTPILRSYPRLYVDVGKRLNLFVPSNRIVLKISPLGLADLVRKGSIAFIRVVILSF